MKNILFILILLLVFINNTNGQDNENIHFMESKNGSVYVDNSDGAYFSICFPGDSIKTTSIKNAYFIGDKFYQIIKHQYTSEQYTNKSDSTKELTLLQYYEDYEVEYLEKELYKKKIDVHRELFSNKNGKRFHLWYYKMPRIDSLEKEMLSIARWHLYLTFVANNEVVGIYTPLVGTEDLNEKIETIKEMAESLDVFAYKVDLEALNFKLYSESKGEAMAFSDSIRNYKFDVPEWLNIIESGENNMAGSFPGINNVINVFVLTWYANDKFKTFKKFNKKMVFETSSEQKILLRKKMEAPNNCNGVNYQIQSAWKGSIYKSQYLTFKTKTHYLFLLFMATNETYDKNYDKFMEFINTIELIK